VLVYGTDRFVGVARVHSNVQTRRSHHCHHERFARFENSSSCAFLRERTTLEHMAKLCSQEHFFWLFALTFALALLIFRPFNDRVHPKRPRPFVARAVAEMFCRFCEHDDCEDVEVNGKLDARTPLQHLPLVRFLPVLAKLELLPPIKNGYCRCSCQ